MAAPGPGKLLHNPIGNPKPSTLAQRLSERLGRKLTQRSPRTKAWARARPGVQTRVVVFGARQRITVGHGLEQLLHHLPLKLVCGLNQLRRRRRLRGGCMGISGDRLKLYHCPLPICSRFLGLWLSRSLVPVLSSLVPCLKALPDPRRAPRLPSWPAESRSRLALPLRYVAIPQPNPRPSRLLSNRCD